MAGFNVNTHLDVGNLDHAVQVLCLSLILYSAAVFVSYIAALVMLAMEIRDIERIPKRTAHEHFRLSFSKVEEEYRA